MKDLQKALPHMLTALSVIVALVVLALDHIIAGSEAYGGILMAGGFTLGGTVASGSISTAATAAVDVSHSTLPPRPTSSTPPLTPSTTPNVPVSTTSPPTDTLQP